MNLALSKCFHLLQWLKCCCKYLTYKEWKHAAIQEFSADVRKRVSTLPIRNGNEIVMNGHVQKVDSKVSTLPIRNGNRTHFLKLLKISPQLYVSTLPIRNGNISTNWRDNSGGSICKYLTYKEWKRFLHCYPTSLSSYVITFTINNIQTCYIYSIFIFYSYSVVVYLNKIKNSSIIQCYCLLLKNIFICM